MTSPIKADPEFNWIFRTLSNALNVYLTMYELIIYDNTVNMDVDNLHALSYPALLAFFDLLIYIVVQ
ncbi:hypothetical protein M0804_010278 [Polistes exclamans]|nr:hypothetical protein M0804_010278 [Polistes exclamans]